MSDTWEVIRADPEGFWLMPVGSKDLTEWAWMEEEDPTEEIERLRDSLDKALGFRVDLKDSSSGSALDALDAMIDQRGKERDDEIERLSQSVCVLEKSLAERDRIIEKLWECVEELEQQRSEW